MKVQAGRADAFAKSPDTKAQAVLVYGPDSGLVRERVEALQASVLKGDADPFRLADLDSATLKSDPARLADEAASMSLTGGRRFVKVRDATDGISKTVEGFLEDIIGDALVVFYAGDLGPRSSLRKLFEGADNAAALPCYSDDARALDQVVREGLKDAGLTAEPDALTWLVSHMGGDRALSRREVEKLVLFKGGDDEKTVTLDDAMACVGDTAAFDLDDLVYAMADGNQPAVQRVYGRMMAEGTSPISVLTAASRHLMRLHQVQGSGGSLDQAMMKLRPPVFFKRKGQFKSQAGRWSPKLLARGLEVLTTAELQAKSTDMPGQALIERALMQIATAAKSARR
ncbi:MAG: DNA polymerase III subunit delta [Alphaproteobacteria bacterium]|nr:DNA polymerase III subunit delta [Alphaproteobacteria bacterium]